MTITVAPGVPTGHYSIVVGLWVEDGQARIVDGPFNYTLDLDGDGNYILTADDGVINAELIQPAEPAPEAQGLGVGQDPQPEPEPEPEPEPGKAAP